MIQIKKCDFCGSEVNLKENKEIYNGNNMGRWPWVYLCANDDCRAYIACKPMKHEPGGTLADHELRMFRKKCQDWIRLLYEERRFNKLAAKDWLASKMGIDIKEFNINYLNKVQCDNAISICFQYFKGSDSLL